MFIRIINYLIALISIDIFYICYKMYRKILIKRINHKELDMGISENQLSTDKDLGNSNVTLIIYILSVIIMGFYINFINYSQYDNSSFLTMLKIQFTYILIPFLIFQTINVIIKYIKDFFSFLKGFKEGILNDEDEEDEEEENEEEIK